MVANLSRSFGGIRAIDDISFTVAEHQMYGLIGPNGAGKTTLLNCVSGVLAPGAGRVRLKSVELAGLASHKVMRKGVSRTFQTTEHFKNFSVLEFVLLGRLSRRVKSVWGCGLGMPLVGRSERRERAYIGELLERFGLAEYAQSDLREISYGTQKIVDVVRAVASEPALLLLDEPTSGSSESERQMLRRVMSELVTSGVTTIVVDHDVGFVRDCCDSMMAMAVGAKLCEGAPADVMSDPAVMSSYLGNS